MNIFQLYIYKRYKYDNCKHLSQKDDTAAIIEQNRKICLKKGLTDHTYIHKNIIIHTLDS